MPIEIIECEQNTEVWYQARIGIPTASNFQCLMAEKGDGKGRATYMRQLAGEIITGLPCETFRSPAMDRGHAMEDEIRRLYAFMHDAEPVRIGFAKNGRKGCSPDSLIVPDGVLEIKTQRPDILIETYEKDVFPNVHKAQTQGVLLIMERDWNDIAIGYTGMPLFSKRAYRDVGYLTRLNREIDQFNEELDALVEKIRRYGAQPEARAAA